MAASDAAGQGQHVLVTGAAGFIGYHVAKALTARGDRVTGIDNLSPYYDVSLKKARIEDLTKTAGDAFTLEAIDLADGAATGAVFSRGYDRVIHLAAQAGVRHSLTAPGDYVSANL
ncbi:MAG: NAD-dependent epimerase/dehydratase family protein, partial [Pseudomonadota bacterium]